MNLISLARSSLITNQMLSIKHRILSYRVPSARSIYLARPFSMNEIFSRRPHPHPSRYYCDGHGKTFCPVMIVPMARVDHVFESLRWIYMVKELASPRRYCKYENQRKNDTMTPDEIESFTANDLSFQQAFQELYILNYNQEEYSLYEYQLKEYLDKKARDAYYKEKEENLLKGEEELKTGQEELKTGQEELKTGQEELKTGQEELKTEKEELKTEKEKLKLLERNLKEKYKY